MANLVECALPAPEGYRFEPGPGPYPYFGRPLARGIASIDDFNAEGVHLVLEDGVRCRSQKNTFLSEVVAGRLYADKTCVVLAVDDEGDAVFLQQVLANTDTTGILLNYFSQDCHIDLDAFMAIEFYYPGKVEADALVRAYTACDGIAAAVAAYEEATPRALDDVFEAVYCGDGEKGKGRAAGVSSRRTSMKLGDAALLSSGRDLAFSERISGEVPIVSPFGITGWHNKPLTTGPAIVLGLKGPSVWMTWSDKACWPVGKTVYLDKASTDLPLATLYFALRPWVEMQRGAQFVDAAALKNALRDTAIPLIDGVSEPFEQAACAALRSIELQREKLRVVKALRESFFDLKATGLL